MNTASQSIGQIEILIAEDDKGLNHLICKNLKRHNYKCVQAFNGKQAIDAIESDKNQILILDYQLPDSNGNKVIKALKEKNSKVPPFIVMTGFGDEKIAVEMMKLGARHYIIKESDFIEILTEKINLIVNDLSQQKNLEETKARLEKTQQDYKVLFESMAEGVVYQNEKGVIISANRAAEKILGLTLDQMTDMTPIDSQWEIFDEDYNQLPGEKHPSMVTLKTGKRVDNLVLSVFNPQKNDYVWILVNSVPQFKKGQTQPFQVYSTFTDITERKKAERQLKESEKKFRDIFENAALGIFRSTPEGKYEEVNSAFARILGFDSPQKIIDEVTDISKLYKDPADREKIKEEFAERGFVEDYEVIANHPGKETVWISINAKQQQKPDGQIYFEGTIQDITDKRKAEERLKESKEEISRILENSMDGILLTAPDGSVLSANRAACKMFGRSEKEICELGREGLVDLSDSRLSTFLEHRNKKGKAKTEIFLLRKDGSRFPSEVSSALYKDKKGNYKSSMIIRDITERKKAEKEISRTEKKFRSLIENAPDGVVIIDADGIITYGSPNAFRHFGYKENEIIGHSGAEFTHPDDLSQISNVFTKLFSNPTQSVTVKYRFKRRNGEFRWIETTFTNLLKDDAVQGIELNFSDITEKTKAETDLITAKERAEESDRLKSAFLANMSHEIRTPMNGILGFTQLLQEPDISGEQMRGYIGVIRESGNRLLDTVSDLIDISRIETGQVEVNLEETNLKNEIQSLYSFFEPEAREKGLDFALNLKCDDAESVIQTDRSKLNSIITNLIKNALKYTNEGSIEIGCKRSNNHIELYLKDTGIGIPAELQENIFNRFVQVEQGYTRNYEGAGLGLSISKAYAEILGGDIRLESEEGRGSVFYVDIPFNHYNKIVKNEINSDETSSEVVYGKIKVLIAEDDEISIQFLMNALGDFADEILIAKNGVEAVTLIRENSDIDIVLMDIKMPRMDGYEAIQKIRDFNNKVIIIAQTGFALSGDREKALEAGCDDYISKPVKIKTLKTKINRLIQNKST